MKKLMIRMQKPQLLKVYFISFILFFSLISIGCTEEGSSSSSNTTTTTTTLPEGEEFSQTYTDPSGDSSGNATDLTELSTTSTKQTLTLTLTMVELPDPFVFAVPFCDWETHFATNSNSVQDVGHLWVEATLETAGIGVNVWEVTETDDSSVSSTGFTAGETVSVTGNTITVTLTYATFYSNTSQRITSSTPIYFRSSGPGCDGNDLYPDSSDYFIVGL